MTEQVKLIEVKENVLADNNKLAGQLRETLKASGTLLINLMASPGAGKTSTLLAVAEKLKDDIHLGVMEADIDSVVDAQTLIDAGVPAIQIRTGGFCHMDATMVKDGLDAFDYSRFDLVILENVGNLVCPAEFDTGANKNIMILSVPEGDDKPLKYPLMFSVCDLLIINKTDYLGMSDFNVDLLKERVRKLNPDIMFFEISCKTGAGVDALAHWLKEETRRFKS